MWQPLKSVKLTKVILVDYNLWLDDLTTETLPPLVSSILQQAVMRSNTLVIFVFPASSSTISPVEVQTLDSCRKQGLTIRRVVLQLSGAVSPHWAEGAELVQVILASSGEGWAASRYDQSSRLSLFQLENDHQATLQSSSRHTYGNGRAWGLSMYEFLLEEYVFHDKDEDPEETVIAEIDVGMGQLLDVLLSNKFVEKKYQYLAGAPASQAVRLRVIENKATAHVNQGAKKKRLLAKNKSETDDFLASMVAEQKAFPTMTTLATIPEELKDFFAQCRKLEGEYQVTPMVGLPDNAPEPIVLTDPRCPLPEQKAVRKIGREVVPLAERLPETMGLTKAMLDNSVLLAPSTFVDSLALFPVTGFKKDDLVMTVTGNWKTFQARV